MSNQKLQAAADLQRLATTFRGLLSLADEMVEVGSLEQARDEAQQHLDKLNAEIKTKEELFTKLIAERTSQMEHARKEATETLETAEAQANQMEHDARAQVRKLLEDAHAEAKQIVAEARAVAQGHQAQTFEHRKVVDALRTEHADLTRNIQDAKREHGRLTKLIDDLKAKF
jgi:cell division septum initiation protein DivIVA